MGRRNVPAAFGLVLLAVFAAACGRPGRERTGVTPMVLDDPATYWVRNRFVEMTPPVRLPSADGKERIVIWLRVPDGGRLRIVKRDGLRPTIGYPDGTVADRVDMRDGSKLSSVVDVRGTRFEGGAEYFHVFHGPESPYAPSASDMPGSLPGVEWPRGDAAASRGATQYMLTLLAKQRGVEDYRRDPMLRQFEHLNDCAGCHVHDRSERSAQTSGVAGGPSRANRGTDDDGLYTIATVLEDEAPLETHRDRDMNEGDRYVHVTCAGGMAGSITAGIGGRRHFACADESTPRGHYDLSAALDAGEAHAAAVCASRAYLRQHMDEEGRRVFASAFDECERR